MKDPLQPSAFNLQPDLYQFPATCFICNGFWQQWFHMLSELLEIAWAWIWGEKQHAVTEVWNLKHSGETMHRIQSGMGLDVSMGKEETYSDNLERGYYQSLVGRNSESEGL